MDSMIRNVKVEGGDLYYKTTIDLEIPAERLLEKKQRKLFYKFFKEALIKQKPQRLGEIVEVKIGRCAMYGHTKNILKKLGMVGMWDFPKK